MVSNPCFLYSGNYMWNTFKETKSLMPTFAKILDRASRVQPGQSHLLHFIPDPDGRLLTFAGCLPEPQVIHQLIHMAVKPLLALLGTPHLNTVFHKQSARHREQLPPIWKINFF